MSWMKILRQQCWELCHGMGKNKQRKRAQKMKHGRVEWVLKKVDWVGCKHKVHIKNKKATKVGKGRVEWVLFKVNEEIEDRCGG